MPEPTDDPAVLAPIRPTSGMLVQDDLGRVTRLAAYGVIHRGEEVLLCRIAPAYPGAGRWTLPGGGIEFGESPAAAALREVTEETGVVARITGAPRIHSNSGVWPARAGRPHEVRFHQVRFVYPMEVVGGEERVEVGGSTDAFGWFALDLLADMPIVALVSLALGMPVREDDDEAASVADGS